MVALQAAASGRALVIRRPACALQPVPPSRGRSGALTVRESKYQDVARSPIGPALAVTGDPGDTLRRLHVRQAGPLVSGGLRCRGVTLSAGTAKWSADFAFRRATSASGAARLRPAAAEGIQTVAQVFQCH
jgi:hypothetical protein